MSPRAAKSSGSAQVVIRTVESTGSARTGWDAAIVDAVRRSKQKRVVGFEVVRLAGEIRTGKVATYRATVRVAYREGLTGP